MPEVPTVTIEWNEVIAKEVISALQKIAPKAPPCSFCGNQKWSLQNGFVYFSLQKRAGIINIGGPGMPCIALTCTKCGNTQFLNMIVLGLKHLIENPSTEQKVGNKDG